MTVPNQPYTYFMLPIVRKIQKTIGGKRLAELEKKEKHYHKLLDALDIAPMAIIITGGDGRAVYINKRMDELLQSTETGKFRDAVHPDDRPRYIDFREGVVAAAMEETVEIRYMDAGKGLRWLRLNAKPIGEKTPDDGLYFPFLAIVDDITDRKNDEEKIRLSEERYRTILDTISDEYWEVDLNGQFVFWNRAFERNARMSAEEIKRLTPSDYTDQETARYIESTFREVAKTGRTILDEISIYRFNDEKTALIKRTVHNSVHLKRDNKGEPIGFFGFARDITKLKQTELALQESEEKFKVMSDQSLLGISIIQDDKSLYRNDAMTDIFGYSHEEMNKRFSSKFIYDNVLHPDDRDFVIKQYDKKQRGIQEGQVHNYQYKLITKQGDIKWMNQFSKTITYGGKPADLITMIDITHQKKAEEELLASQHRLATHIESTPMGVIEFDNDFVITAWNPAAEEIFGFFKEEAVGKYIFDFLVPDYERQNVEKVQNIINPRSNKNVNDNLTKDGRIITVQWFNTPIKDIQGNLLGMAAVAQDITEQLKTQKLLIQSEKMMSIGGLAAGMAHEINNPLGAIMQVTQNMKRRLDPDFGKNVELAEKYQIDLNAFHDYMEERGIIRFMDAIVESGKRAARIITDMLHFSRKSEAEKTPLNLNEVLEQTLVMASQDYDLKKKYDFRHITIIREFDNSLTSVPCSETEIEQVFLNLLKNCAQAIGDSNKTDSPQIVLRTAMEKSMARVEIEDNGPGIEESVRSRIFEPFFTTKPVGEGTGLGLSVSYMIITGNHQGTMEVESGPGKGTKFVIRLPLALEP